MIKFNNEKGITLVEVLVVLLISSILGVILYSIVILTMNYNTVETTKTSLQQEANYIVTEIQRIHRQCDSYILSISTDNIAIKDCIISEEDSVENLNKVISNTFNYAPKMEEPIEPKKENYTLESFIVKDPNNESLSVELRTEFSRYISEQEEDMEVE